MPKPTETVPLVLKYSGPDVDDGSMSLEDIVPVLQGFSSAYGKIAAEQGAGLKHRIRITGVKQSSADILLEIWEAIGQAANPLTTIQIVGGAAISIIGTIVGVIRAKRHTKNKPFREKIIGDNFIEVTNSENVTIQMPVHVFQIFKSKTIDQDIANIVRPLETGRIDSAEIIATPQTGAQVREIITADEKQYFEGSTTTTTKTAPTWVVGQLNALTKSTESGFLYLTDGTRVHYKYIGDSPQKLHAIFGTHDGPVRLNAVAHLDENLKVVKLDILDVERAQGTLFPTSAELPPGSEDSN